MKAVLSVLRFTCCFLVLCAFGMDVHALDAGTELTCNTDDLSSETSATFQANWAPVEWTVVYNINGASAGTAPANQNCQYTGVCNAAVQGELLKNNSVFTGWAMTCSVGGGACEDFTPRTVSGGSSIANVTASDGATVTLTAVWNECSACNATNASCSLSIVDNQCVYTTACLPGYENITGNGTAQPSCTAKVVGLTYVDDDGITPIDPETGTCTYGEHFNLPAAPTKQGFKFLGWTLVQ